MLANILRCSLASLSAVFAAGAGWSTAEMQSPVQSAPPSVHVPPSQVSELPEAAKPVVYRMGDTSSIARAAEPGLQFPPRPEQPVAIQGNGFVQQASYDAAVPGNTGSAPPIPSLLAGDAPLLPPSPAMTLARKRMGGPGFRTQDPVNGQRMPAGLTAPPRAAGPTGQQASGTQLPLQTSNTAVGTPRETDPQLVTPRLPQSSPVVQANAMPAASGQQPNATAMGLTAASASVPVAGRSSYVATEGPASGSSPVAAGLPVSAGNELPALKMAIPSLEIQAFGPGTVGVHKSVQYRVTCKNRDSLDANRISLAVNLPAWVRVQNVSTSIGRRDKEEGTGSSRIVWMIDSLPSGQTQTMTIDLVATRAETFDLGVDWAMQPVTSSSRVAVTEPRLEMSIAGPNEVLFGETATYEVAVRNPGTGLAENVVVMLPEALGGEKATIGDIPAGQERTFQIELQARAAGQLDLTTNAAAAGNLQASSSRNILVRRPQLEVIVAGPAVKYAGSVGEYEVTIRNSGDAVAREVVAAMALPPGVQYLQGVEGSEAVENGLKWNIGTLDVGDQRRYRVACQLNVDGQIGLEVASRGSGEIAAVSRCTTMVETVDDIVLTVEDPKGPLPVNQKIEYVIKIRNRGSRSSGQLNLDFMFSEGIEPTSAAGLANAIEPGKVGFSPIATIEPGQEISLTVAAMANQAGTHKFRAQVTGEQSEAHEVCEGTTRFYGEGGDRTAESGPPQTPNSIR